MSLTGRGTVILMIALALGSIALAGALWNCFPRPGWVRWPVRVSLVVVCQLTAVALAAVALNDTDRFYNSWSELIGGHQGTMTATRPNRPSFADELRRQLARQHHRGGSAMVSVQIPESGSARTHTALVYLPAAYFTPFYESRQFPVIELLDGYPGSPQTWAGPMHVQRTADAEIVAGRAVPFIAVMAAQNFLPADRDGECLDVPGGPQVESTLVHSVRETMLADFRVTADRRSWAVMGYSTGGYCALKIALRFPDQFASAVSILGNASPYQDSDTGLVFTRHPGLREDNDPAWLVTHRTQPDVALFLASSRGDPATRRAAQAFARLAHAPLRVESCSAATGGHNFQTFRLYEPIGFDWLSGQLRAPLAPGATVKTPAPHSSPSPSPPVR